jgi:hypothetical protein
VINVDRALTHNPSSMQRMHRCLWELARFAIPPISAGAGLLSFWGYFELVDDVPDWANPLLMSALVLIDAIFLCLFTVVTVILIVCTSFLQTLFTNHQCNFV